jgi:multidrug efflux pump subunit AcrB/predicted DNA-binding transcriptional regulator
MIEQKRNTARFFVETRHVAWVLLFATCLWGIYGYLTMPQRKDPEVQVRQAVALVPWPGASAERVEQLVTKKVEEQMAANSKVTKIESISRTGIAVVYVELDENLKETGKEFDDIKLKLDAIHDLPQGAGPINFVKDFGDTAALMLTVASPLVSEQELAPRARELQQVIEQARARAAAGGQPFTLVFNLPQSVAPRMVRAPGEMFLAFVREKGFARDVRFIEGGGFFGFDGVSDLNDEQLLAHVRQFTGEKLQAAEFHPDAWPPVVVRDPREAQAKLQAAGGDKYTYRELDDFTDRIEKTLKLIPQVSKVSRSGLLNESIFLFYSQERLAAYGIQPAKLDDILSARNISTPGGQVNVEGKNVTIDPSGEFKSENEIGNTLIPTNAGRTVYLRDVADVVRSYDVPARYLNYFNWRDDRGQWHRSRAITLSVQMRSGEQIDKFGQAIDETLANLKQQLPADLIYARTSDQPLQVEESIDLFMKSLYEAIILVVVVALIGFWEWRSALLMALAIPITLFMTFGMMRVLGIDLQQVSIATLIIALGLLVDDPVVAGDAIKRDLAIGHPSIIAAWLGPTKLATAILYATITNIVAYVPFLLLGGSTGEFIYSLPVVLTCSLVASRLVSMTFIPLLAYYLLKPKAEMPIAERRKKGFAALYYRIGTWAINHRWRVLAASLVVLLLGGVIMSQLRTQFFPKDLSYLSYVDVWLPEDAPLSATNEAAARAEQVIRETVAEYARHHAEQDGAARDVLQSLTTFVGGGGPRFWFSVAPELQQLNYAQIIIQVKDKHDTSHLVEPLQRALSAQIPGARIDVRQLESGKAVGLPVAIRLTGEDMATLRALAERTKNILEGTQLAERPRDDWGGESFAVKLQTNPDRAVISGLSNIDVAVASYSATYGQRVTSLREGDREIPVVARLRMEERAQLDDLQNLYVYSSQGQQKVPLRQVAQTEYGMQAEKVRARNQFRTITVSAMPAAGHLASEVMKAARPQLTELQATLPAGYRLEIGGEEEDQVKGFTDLTVVLAISVAAIFLALVFQFKNAIKPFIVFAAVPYGMVGALAALWVMGAPFGFMAFLGIVSLVGVIVSHIIVLFDFIEEKHAEGEPLIEALLDAGIMRLRPVLITVGATVIALFPLASHGGPLWEPMCYAQIGGLCAATFITLLLVPVLYAIFVLDLKLVKWETTDGAHADAAADADAPSAAQATEDFEAWPDDAAPNATTATPSSGNPAANEQPETPVENGSSSQLKHARNGGPNLSKRRQLMNTLRTFLCCGLLLLCACAAATAQTVQTDYDHSFNLARLKTYDFYPQDRKPGDPLAASPLNDRRIHNALDAQLRANGLNNVTSGQADFLIAYFVTTRRGLDIQDNRLGLLQRMGSINVSQVTEGTIVVIFVNRATQQEVWRGYVSGTINPKDLDKDVNKGIAKLVQKFVKEQAGKK